MLEFPNSVPFDAIQQGYAMLKDGTYKTQQLTFSKCAWNVAGFAFPMFLKDSLVPIGATPAPQLADAEWAVLQNCHDSACAVVGAKAGDNSTLSPLLILALQAMIEALKLWLANRKT